MIQVTMRKNKGKRFERDGRKAPGLKLRTAMMAELLFAIVWVYVFWRVKSQSSLGTGSFRASNWAEVLN